MLAVRGWGYTGYIKVRGVGTRMNKGQNNEFKMCWEVKINCQRCIKSDAMNCAERIEIHFSIKKQDFEFS